MFQIASWGYDRTASMSMKAVDAIHKGVMPMDMWTADKILAAVRASPGIDAKRIAEQARHLPLDVLKKLFLRYEGYHHVGRMYRKTAFYSVSCFGVTVDAVMRERKELGI